MIVEAGKFYKTRDGMKVGPMKVWTAATEDNTDNPLFDTKAPGFTSYFWRRDGFNGDRQVENYPHLDLISEWPAEPTSPIRETVKREPVQGKYGIVIIGDVERDGRINICLQAHGLSIPMISADADQLEAAASVITQIAAVLRENGK